MLKLYTWKLTQQLLAGFGSSLTHLKTGWSPKRYSFNFHNRSGPGNVWEMYREIGLTGIVTFHSLTGQSVLECTVSLQRVVITSWCEQSHFLVKPMWCEKQRTVSLIFGCVGVICVLGITCNLAWHVLARNLNVYVHYRSTQKRRTCDMWSNGGIHTRKLSGSWVLTKQLLQFCD